MARPKGTVKLSPEIQEKIVECLREGNWMETAAAMAGLSKDTLYSWLRQGAEDRRGKFGRFSDAVRQAQAEAEADDLKAIGKAKYDDWRAAAWRLERRNPKRFGKATVARMAGDGPEGDKSPEGEDDFDLADLELPDNGREAKVPL